MSEWVKYVCNDCGHEWNVIWTTFCPQCEECGSFTVREFPVAM